MCIAWSVGILSTLSLPHPYQVGPAPRQNYKLQETLSRVLAVHEAPWRTLWQAEQGCIWAVPHRCFLLLHVKAAQVIICCSQEDVGSSPRAGKAPFQQRVWAVQRDPEWETIVELCTAGKCAGWGPNDGGRGWTKGAKTSWMSTELVQCSEGHCKETEAPECIS